jgi:rhodanese-related sulfurtransferase
MGFFNSVFGGSNNENLATLVNEGAFLVDVRSSDEFAEGNVKRSTNIPLDQVSSNLDKFKGKEKIVVFCRSGNRSGQAKAILEQNGFTNVTNGGTWQNVNEVINK